MASDNVIRLVGMPEHDGPTADDVMQGGIERGLTSVFVLGHTPEGTLWIRSSGDVTRQEALWMIETAKMQVLFGDDDE